MYCTRARVLCDTRVIQVAGTRPDGAPARETKETCVRLVITQLPSASTGWLYFSNRRTHNGHFAIAHADTIAPPGNKLNSGPRLVECIVLVLIIHSFRVLESRGGGLLFFMVFFFLLLSRYFLSNYKLESKKKYWSYAWLEVLIYIRLNTHLLSILKIKFFKNLKFFNFSEIPSLAMSLPPKEASCQCLVTVRDTRS